MGRLKGSANNEAKAARLTLPELNKLVAHAEWRYKDAGLNSAMKRDAFERLVWLETQRETLYGVAAPSRRRPRRGSN